MTLTKTLLMAVCAVSLGLTACSSEPSDWRPDEKVSVDMVPPGTRASEMQASDRADMPSQEKGGAIAEPINSEAKLDERPMPNPREAMSENSVEALEKHGETMKEVETGNTPEAQKAEKE
jgi:hypothetical protein